MLALVIALGALSLGLPPMVTMETCQSSGTPGMPGIPGLTGRDGRDGETGVKGEPGVPVEGAMKGLRGEPGLKGVPGKLGRTGEKGVAGRPGPAGQPGDKGDLVSGLSELQSAFSVARATHSYPEKNTPIRFTTVITNINNHYDTTQGKFVCHTPGTYYFVYHASSEDSLCVNIKLDGSKLASFCDIMEDDVHRQVSSGGVAVYLTKGQKVWLEVDNHQGMVGKPNGNSVFSGYLVFKH